MVGGVPANNIAKWNLITEKWSALESGGYNGVNGEVSAMTVADEHLYVGGAFTADGNISSNRIAKWNPANSTWTSLGDGLNGDVYDIAVHTNAVYVGGAFTLADSTPVNYLAKWEGEAWTALGTGVNHHVTTLSFYENDLYAGGYFTKAGGLSVNYVAKYNVATNNWWPLRAETDTSNGVRQRCCPIANVYSITTSPHGVYIGGSFDLAGNRNANHIVRWNPESNTWSPLGSGVNGQVFDVMATENDVHVGGTFRYAGGKISYRFAIWHEPEQNHAPVINSSLPTLSFNEDVSLLYPISKWHSRVQDQEDADSTLVFTVLSGKKVQATRQGNDYLFTAPENWFGQNKLKLIVTDRSQLADTAEFVVRVKSLNDAPGIANLPESIAFRNTASKRLAMWDFVSDVEDADSSLHFSFSASNDSLKRAFNAQTGVLTLTAPGFIGKANLFLTVRDDSNAVARDTIAAQVDNTTGVAEATSEIPTEFVLLQNYPNPFSAKGRGTFGNPTTTIRFGLPHASEVNLEVFDLSGQRVATLLNESKDAGFHAIEFNASNLSSGTYFYKLTAGSFAERKKLLLVK
ncbi:T9SS type A sorting domain-containing protein [candidate division KSB1 bacterium]|nr:T9SS type A sorting domain-containing protein [candidate division KSB1 bacterium]